MVSLSAIDRDRFGIVTAKDPAFTADTLPDTLRFCRAESVRMLIARCAAEDLRAAQAMEEAGGRLMDTLVYWGRRMDRGAAPEARPAWVRPLRPGEAAEVGRVAAGAFRGYFGHYHADPRLDRAKADEVYVSWAERSCTEPAAASRVLVAEHDGRLAGFLTLLPRGKDELEIVLNGVDPALQRHGLYRGLVLGALDEGRRAGAPSVVVSTQLINLGVQKTWARLGFELIGAYHTFHVWFDGMGATS
jgi:GNAT superfamily N-acetyltransferase